METVASIKYLNEASLTASWSGQMEPNGHA